MVMDGNESAHGVNVLPMAFKTTIPVLAGYLGLGLAFGIMLEDLGYNAF